MIRSTQIIHSRYCDSVVLMRVASQLKRIEAVSEVAMFMGTEGNHDLLRQAGLATTESLTAGPQDLIIIVEAETDGLCSEVLSQAAAMLNESNSGSTVNDLHYRPRTLEQALRLIPDASLAAISIPGEYAAREARKCLDKGLNVFLFSDNVSIEAELELKKLALDRNLLMMGPDCGTSYLNGVGLGFANVVRPGPVGCIAASGTGLQAVVSYLDRQGAGISHAIGVGGRDLSAEIGGIMTITALKLLERDPQTEVIILLSKPPHPGAIQALEAVCRQMTKPVIAYFQGATPAASRMQPAATLDEAAARALAVLRHEEFLPRQFNRPEQIRSLLAEKVNGNNCRRIIGLFTGGTLAKEAQMILSLGERPVTMNGENSLGHMLLDLGDDQYTVGRPHPMIAPEIRSEKLADLAENGMLADCGVLLFDIVLGNGAHGDPASVLVESIDALRMNHFFSGVVLVSLIGTEADPQNLGEQITLLSKAGLIVFQSNSEAAQAALLLTDRKSRDNFLRETNQ